MFAPDLHLKSMVDHIRVDLTVDTCCVVVLFDRVVSYNIKLQVHKYPRLSLHGFPKNEKIKNL